MDNLSIDDVLGPQGLIARRLKQYEERPEQMAMAQAVGKALAKNRHLVVEAGTGVGKSFAYLVPSILWACGQQGNGEKSRRVVISTHTISLQEQLLEKDIPLINAAVPLEFTAVLAKGRGNYVSLRRLGAASLRSASLFDKDEETAQLRTLKEWSKKTPDGSLSDLDFRPAIRVWDEIASDSGNCLGRKCPTYDDCFYYRARRRMQNAQLLIVNHALFFSDLALRRSGVSLLPSYDAVIFDEAHTLEGVAGDHLGMSVTSTQIDFALNKLFNERTQKGLLVHHECGDAMNQVVHTRYRAQQFFNELDSWLEENPGGNGRVTVPELIPNVLSPAMAKLAQMVKSEGDRFEEEGTRQDFHSLSDRIFLMADSIEAWRMQKMEHTVYWVESSQQRGPYRRVKLFATPIEVGPVLREELFQKVDSVILTSATLSSSPSEGFEFFKDRIGITRNDEVTSGSPFDYKKNVKLVLVKGMPEPSNRRDYDQALADMVKRYVEQTQGHAFVLFTSYDMLRNCASRVSRWMSQNGYTLFSQSDGMPRGQMVQKFKETPGSVLFGTDSFWQGVDVPGDALQNVIITKLPFSVPDHPLLQARLNQIKERGGQPFSEYQLPEAIIKLRQGFGRLIRGHSDKGIVVILDPRIQTKGYGRAFLKALPECHLVEDSFAQAGSARPGWDDYI